MTGYQDCYDLGDTLEQVNYWGLATGRQIMTCRYQIRGGKPAYKLSGVNRLFLW